MSNQPHAIVIGAGVAGIASAIRLTKKGYQVSVYEANEKAGGKLTEIHLGAFRFDAGPSLFTMPSYMEELFQLHGKSLREHFGYEQLPVVCRYFYEDGLQLDATADVEQFKKILIETLGESPKQVAKFFKKASQLYEITAPVFLDKSLHKLSTFFHKDTLRSMLRLHQLDVFRTMHQANEALFDNPKTVQLFDRYATYNGSNPYQAPATLNIISHLEHDIGAFFPSKGMYSITQALVSLAESVGVDFHYKTPVTSINTEGNRAVGVTVGEERIEASLVVSNMDVTPTYRKLLPNMPAPEQTLSQPKSSSALIFYWGIDREFPTLDVHNIFFSDHYEREFKTMFQDRSIDDDPTVYVFISSKVVKEDAPEGKENWFVMINVPNNSGQDWEALIAKARKAIIKKLSRILAVDIESLILCEDYLDPRRIEARTASVGGALYGNSSNNRFAAFLRHPNFSRKIDNLYFCGGSVHPGGGIPLCLLSAKIVGDLIPDQS